MPFFRRSVRNVFWCLSAVVFLTSPAMLAQSVPKPAPKPTTAPDPLVRMNESIDALTRKVWPSVVQILVSSYGPRAEGATGRRRRLVVGRQRSTGSGFVIDPDGYILTNAHVVSGARRVQVVLPAATRTERWRRRCPGILTLPARIVGITTELDLALLKVDGMKLPALPLATYSRGPAGRNRVCIRQPDRPAQQPDARPGVGRGAAGRSRFAAHLHPDRRADQSRQLRWTAGQHPRRSRGRQHVHRVAVRRQRWPGVRDPERDRSNGLPPAESSSATCDGRRSA